MDSGPISYGYGVIQSYVMGAVIAVIYSIDNDTHASRFQSFPIGRMASGNVLSRLHDLNTYLIHRMPTCNKFLWRTHEAHHATEQVDWLSGIQVSLSRDFAIRDGVVSAGHIVGCLPWVPLYKGMVNAIYGMYIHSNLNISMGKLFYSSTDQNFTAGTTLKMIPGPTIATTPLNLVSGTSHSAPCFGPRRLPRRDTVQEILHSPRDGYANIFTLFALSAMSLSQAMKAKPGPFY